MVGRPADLEKKNGASDEVEAELSPVALQLSQAEQIAALKELMASAQSETVQMEQELVEETAYRNRMYMVREIAIPRETPEGLACIEKLLRAAVEKVEMLERDIKAQREFAEICDRKLFILQHR